MTSLADAYEGRVGEHVDRRRLYAGVGLFSLGVVLALAGIVIAGSEPSTSHLGYDTAREYGGILAGVGVPAVFMGIFTVLPAGKITRAAAVVGSGIAVLGVALFSYAYPCRWSGAVCPNVSGELTLPVAAVYTLGVVTTFWCLFVGVVNFKTRNDPGGTVELEISRGGETQVIEVPESELETNGAGGVGFFGETPDGEVATQTNRSPVDDNSSTAGADSPTDGTASSWVGADTTRSDSGRDTTRSDDVSSGRFGGDRTGDGERTSGGFGSRGGTHASDGAGRGGTDVREPAGEADGPATGDVDEVRRESGVTDATTAGSPRSGGSSDEIREVEPSEVATTPGDSYCGSCAHFQYVRTDDGMQPYCGYHDELMDDMDACSEWTQR